MSSKIMTLTNRELNKKAKKIIKENFKGYGAKVIEKDRTFLVTSKEGREIEVLVKSIRRPTEYVLILKKYMDVRQDNLYIALVIFSGENTPELFLIPATAFLEPNDLLRDRPNYKEPEFGMNVSNKNMPALNIYKFTNSLDKI
ncbi:hypothetical protein AWW70_19180 [Bacillus mycoides]|uniref:Uncharacterized protein n=1 Tax=Bacillus mycoides TaxID=1405 RepID=A0A109G2K0_BACMY|nr:MULTISPECIES: hypothetical protein [Bacillus cereus group]KWU58959.1 hypothetical protein AWW70_19180 [Bacillus mycoides]MCU5303206.1 hypothetical protein [Bacillus toyonensis]TBX46478.1 hypothetical protein E0M44_16285 [Bacillus toyonensis]